LHKREQDLFAGHLHAKQSTQDIASVINGGKVVVLNGCKDHSAAKKLNILYITPHIHIIATKDGIEKNGISGSGV
jgi:uncharacterized metal-binding protein